MPLTSPNKIMGKVKSPSFFKGAGSSSTPAKKSNIPVLLMIVLAGVALIWFLKSRSSTASNTAGSTQTGAALNLVSSAAPDQSTIDNLTASINALQGQVYAGSTIPTGGASTPITSSPTTATPATPAPQVMNPAYDPSNTAAQFTANPNLAYQNPQDLLSQIMAANTAGKTQVQLPSGELWATNQATIDLIQKNIAAAATTGRK